MALSLVIWATWSGSWPCKMGGKKTRKNNDCLLVIWLSHERWELVCSVLFFVIWIWCDTRTRLSQIGPRTLFWVGGGWGHALLLLSEMDPPGMSNNIEGHVPCHRSSQRCILDIFLPKFLNYLNRKFLCPGYSMLNGHFISPQGVEEENSENF